MSLTPRWVGLFFMSGPIFGKEVKILVRLKRVWNTLTRWCTRTRVYLFTVTAHAVSWVRDGIVVLLHRHRHRWSSDSAYRRTVLAALVAVASTVMPHPVTAAALGALIADYTPRSRWESYEEDDDEWRPQGRPLWETPFR